VRSRPGSAAADDADVDERRARWLELARDRAHRGRRHCVAVGEQWARAGRAHGASSVLRERRGRGRRHDREQQVGAAHDGLERAQVLDALRGREAMRFGAAALARRHHAIARALERAADGAAHVARADHCHRFVMRRHRCHPSRCSHNPLRS
jgi:hypothetical protein